MLRLVATLGLLAISSAAVAQDATAPPAPTPAPTQTPTPAPPSAPSAAPAPATQEVTPAPAPMPAPAPQPAPAAVPAPSATPARAATPAPAAAPASPAPAAAPTAPCAAEEYHQLDFWVGKWDVYPTGKDNLVAHSLIESVYGCGIRENWMPLSKQPGGSLSVYVPAEKHWEQFWIDSSGSRAFFTGGWDGKAMVITGKWGGPLVRMSYTRNEDGSVRQFGEQSADEGKNWTPQFDFTYRPSKTAR